MRKPTDRPVVTVIGSGMMGSAITWPAADNGCRIRLVGSVLDDDIIDRAAATGVHPTLKRKFRRPENYEFYRFSDVGEALSGADLLICGVSSFGLDWFTEKVIPILPDGTPVLSVTKGLLHRGGGEVISYPEMMEEAAAAAGKNHDFMAVGGPCTSYELADLDPSAVTFCGRDPSLLRQVRELFESPYYSVSLSTDVRGVECAVALKNAYALGVTLAVGLSYAREGREIEHYNSEAALFGQAAAEMTALLRLFGGGDECLPLGIGDLYVTVFGGRTRRLGILLGRGMTAAEALKELNGVTLESTVITVRMCEAVRALEDAGRLPRGSFPLLGHVGALLEGGEPRPVPWKSFETERF